MSLNSIGSFKRASEPCKERIPHSAACRADTTSSLSNFMRENNLGVSGSRSPRLIGANICL
ncbi:hypothetical protein PGT21_023208 [Puccinia graminis f. sp. tritici]|uniref:Uncharacterized protein n=1 Tax=Puccinia graminis f. sp. tritici TaxID=56615 RepID=A0A5B0QTU5_PUCGR|nr:hypothetical protein PGT21_023208 [Puccinia graminis f. sp. tritici]